MAIIVIAFVLLAVLYLVWLERKVSADLQSRVGPNRVGGRFGPAANRGGRAEAAGKEDIIPACADKWVFILAPVPGVRAGVAGVLGGAVLRRRWIVQDLNLGVLFVIAVSALPVIGLLMAGWGSNNKYALLGAMRAAAQAISYEIPLVLAMVCVVIAAGSMRVGDIVGRSNCTTIGSSPIRR